MEAETPTEPRRDGERGASLVEYALLLALIAAVCITAITFLGDENRGSIDCSGEQIANAIEVTATTSCD